MKHAQALPQRTAPPHEQATLSRRAIRATWIAAVVTLVSTAELPAQNLTVGGSDLVLGNNDGRAIGSNTRQRALVHDHVPNGAKFNDILVLNYSGDFEGGVHIQGPRLLVGGQHVASGPHTNYRLSVDGKLVAREIVVTSGTEWADHIFADGYPLLPLPDLERFISAHRHLPGVPTAAEVEKEGLDLARVTATLLAKVEELTLHLIAQDKALSAQRALLADQDRALQRLIGIETTSAW